MFDRMTSLGEALARAALKDEQSLQGKSERWIARSVADKVIHQQGRYKVREFDRRPEAINRS